MTGVEFTVHSGIFSVADISPMPGKKPSLRVLDKKFLPTNDRTIIISDYDLVAKGETGTPASLTSIGFQCLTKIGGHPGFPRTLHGNIAEYCVMHALTELHGLTKPGHHPKTGGKTPDFVYEYYIGVDNVEIVTECKASGTSLNARKSRGELLDALVNQIGKYKIGPNTLRCVHCVNLQARVIRNYWIGTGMPPFTMREKRNLTGLRALNHLRNKFPWGLLTFFLAKWLGENLTPSELDAIEGRAASSEHWEGTKNIYAGLKKIDYECADIERNLVVGETPKGWYRLDEYRIIRPIEGNWDLHNKSWLS